MKHIFESVNNENIVGFMKDARFLSSTVVLVMNILL